MIEKLYRAAIIPSFETVFKRRLTFQAWKSLDESQWWSGEQLQQWQWQRLRSIIDHCFQTSSYYRKTWTAAGLTSRSLQSIDDLCKWPITSRQTMRDQASSLRSDVRVPVVAKSTGGSSGSPLSLVIDCEANDRRTAAAYRGYDWAGAAPGNRQTHLWGIDLRNTSRWKRWKEHLYLRYLYRRDVLNSFELSDDSIADYVARINRYRPAAIVAYTNPLYLLAKLIEHRGIQVYSPQSIVVGAEKLYDFQREQIERVFAAPVFETYGSREFSLIGAECNHHSGLHLSNEQLIVEIVDDQGNPTPPGQEGRIIVTDLFNVAMPFIRYEIGDRGVASQDRCACGRGLPLLQSVVGRQLDILTTPDGRQLPGEFFPHLIKDYPPVLQFQVIQTRPDVLDLNLVVDSRWSEHSRDSLHHQIMRFLGTATKLRISEVDEIPLTGAGKLRVVVGYPSQHSSVAANVAGNVAGNGSPSVHSRTA